MWDSDTLVPVRSACFSSDSTGDGCFLKSKAGGTQKRAKAEAVQWNDAGLSSPSPAPGMIIGISIFSIKSKAQLILN